jgi:LPPG:FO 2-phospho-L-lactate transferase
VREALGGASAPVVAVAPIVSGVPIDDPGEAGRAKSRSVLLRAAGVEPSASGVAGMYADRCQRYVLDRADAAEADAVRELGLEVVLVDTLVHRGAPAEALVDAVLGAAVSM